MYTDRVDAGKGSAELFFKLVKGWKDSKGHYPPPVVVSTAPPTYMYFTAIIHEHSHA